MKLTFLIVAAATLLLAGCAGDTSFGLFDGPYIGGFGYYPDGGFYHRGFAGGRGHYHHYSGLHHFVGHSFAASHFAGSHAFGGFRGGGFHGGGFHGGGGRP